MNGIVIRPVQRQDIPAVTSLRIKASLQAYSAFDAKQLETWVNKRHSIENVLEEAFGPKTLMLVGCYRQQIVATAYAKISTQDFDCDVYIGGLYIDAAFRGQGLGNALVQARLQWAKQQGATKVLTEVEQTNVVAMNLMKKHGFVEQKIIDWEKYVPAMRWSQQTLDLSLSPHSGGRL